VAARHRRVTIAAGADLGLNLLPPASGTHAGNGVGRECLGFHVLKQEKKGFEAGPREKYPKIGRYFKFIKIMGYITYAKLS